VRRKKHAEGFAEEVFALKNSGSLEAASGKKNHLIILIKDHDKSGS
jgi:hypothetical protein